MKVGIAGCGGIGSNVSNNLIRSGFSNLKLVDFDKIEKSNLNRQFYFFNQIGLDKVVVLKDNLLRINNNALIETEKKLLTTDNISETFEDCDIIVEGFDKAKLKSMLIDKYSNTNKLIVSACGVAGLDIDKIQTKKIGENIYIVGDFSTSILEKKLFSPKVLIISSIMANIILKKLGFNDNIV